MSLLTKEQILNAPDTKTEIVEVPEWGGSVKVGTMSGYARDVFESSIAGKNGHMNMTNIRAKLAAATILDEQNEPMFSEKDIIKLGKKSCAALDRVFEAAQKLNRISENDVEDLAKN